MNAPNFAIYYVGDGYSTDKKIMGRQSAGKALMKGVARRWTQSEIHGFGVGRASGDTMLRQLRADGFSGVLRWREAPGDAVMKALGAVYYPAPVTRSLAHARNGLGANAYSLFGVTHTLASSGAMDQIAEMVLPPFKPWDALVCTSSAALSVVTRLQDEMRSWMAEHTGANRFNPIQLPVIPLGVDAPAFVRDDAMVASSRPALKLEPDEVAFLFAGRLTFHAKAHPAAFYLAIEAASQGLGKRLVCIEAGVYPNAGTATSFAQARKALAPSVRFIHVDGQNETLYHQAWKASDVFVSLSDNIQETFGLTPLEAMAAGLPVLVSDWNGYKDTVRDGVDGYRIPVTLPPPGTGEDLALRHALGQDSYDYFIGRTCMAASVDIKALTDRITALATDPALRKRLGAAGQAQIQARYDWPVILDRYVDLVAVLGEQRKAAGEGAREAWPSRPDPFALFADYPTHTLGGGWKVLADPARQRDVEAFLGLDIASFVLDSATLPRETILSLHALAARADHTVDSLLRAQGGPPAPAFRALMWLNKLGLISIAQN